MHLCGLTNNLNSVRLEMVPEVKAMTCHVPIPANLRLSIAFTNEQDRVLRVDAVMAQRFVTEVPSTA